VTSPRRRLAEAESAACLPAALASGPVVGPATRLVTDPAAGPAVRLLTVQPEGDSEPFSAVPISAAGAFLVTPAPAAAAPRQAALPAAAGIGRQAVLALYDELALAPKPGLVSFIDSGSHHDMDARTFMRSLFALRRAFPALATLGERAAPFAELEALGIAAEAQMLRATGGVNTHRGAIFTLGLLCAAAGRCAAMGATLGTTHGVTNAAAHAMTHGRADGKADGTTHATTHVTAMTAANIRSVLLATWGPALQRRALRAADSNGSRAARAFGLRSVGVEAAEGFPVLFDAVWPRLQAALARGLPMRLAQLDALLAAMAVLDDTNLVHRGGIAALRHVQQAARAFLRDGGAAIPQAESRALSLHRELVARRLSPGGAADLLAAACWLQRLTVPA
jgi:triphosphoribosyl-dephospho-CoA synthase